MTARAWWCRLTGLFLVACLACSLWAASLVICPKCGTEAEPSATVCAHCGALLPAVKVEPVAPANTPVPPEKHSSAISTLALDATRADRRLADESLAPRPELAYAYYENALAVSRLVRREGLPASAGKSLAENLERCRNQLAHTTRPCVACNGNGKSSVHFQALAGDKSAPSGSSVTLADGPPCAVCGGSGVVTVGRSADELRVLIAQGRRDFDTRQQAAGRVACGRAWLPPDLLAQLSVKEQALVRTACPTPCAGCTGIGIQDCQHCKGSGRIKCSNGGCVNGWITRKESNTLTPKVAVSRKERCAVCQGAGIVPCSDCRGVGTIPCKTCNGSGRNAVCLDCGGQGWAPCSKCQGAGTVGGKPCPDCHGAGDRLCPKCHGEGCAVK